MYRIWNRKRSGISYCYFVTFLTQILFSNLQFSISACFQVPNYNWKCLTFIFLHTPFLYIVFMYPYPVRHHLRPSIGASGSLFGQTSLFLALTCRAMVLSAPYLAAPRYFRPTIPGRASVLPALFMAEPRYLYYSPIE